MVKNSGRVHDEVVEKLRGMELDCSDIKVATFSRGPDHIVVSGEDTIGEYNHISKRLVLYNTL